MQYRRFGRTELQMPVFSCGGMRYHYKWVDVPLAEVPAENQANLEATIHRAWQLGINHIETARGYGSSERQLGLVLPTFPRDRLIVQTKIAPCRIAAEFRAHVLESLERLQLDYIDLLGIHGVNTHEHFWQTVRPGGCLAAARRLQREGLVRHVGFSTHAPLELILDAVNYEADGGFDYINLHWYYIFQHNWPAIEAAARRDMGVFIISPSSKGGMLHDPPEKLVELCAPLHPLVFNCLFCLRQPEVHTLSLGASQPSDFDLQMSALDDWDPQQLQVEEVAGRLANVAAQTRGEAPPDWFAAGLPAWEATPGHMNIPAMLWLRQLAFAFDMLAFAKMRYNLLGNGGHWFPGANAAHVDELNLGKALADTPCADQIPDWLRETHRLLRDDPQQRESQS